MDVHFMAIPANRTVAVDVPVTVYKVIHIAAIPFAAWRSGADVVSLQKKRGPVVLSFHVELFLWVYTYYNSGITSTI